MKYKILCPNKSFEGVRQGVVFKKGVGETDKPAVAKEFKRRGYEIGDASAPEDPWASVTVPMIDEYAKKNNIEFTGAKNKGDKIGALVALGHTPDKISASN